VAITATRCRYAQRLFLGHGRVNLLRSLFDSVFSATNMWCLPRRACSMRWPKTIYFQDTGGSASAISHSGECYRGVVVWSAALTLRDGFQSCRGVVLLAGFFTDLGRSDFPLRAALGELTQSLPIAFRVIPGRRCVFAGGSAVVGMRFSGYFAIQRNLPCAGWIDLAVLGHSCLFFWRWWKLAVTAQRKTRVWHITSC